MGARKGSVAPSDAEGCQRRKQAQANLKGNELANVAPRGSARVIAAAWQGIERICATWHLPYSFLHHCGLSVA